MTAHLDFVSYCVLDLTEGMRGSVQSVTDMQAEAKRKTSRPTNVPGAKASISSVTPVQGHSHTSCTLGLESGHLSLNTHC